MRDCSVEIFAAFDWSSQKPGAPMASSSSARRRVSASGSKVITDPGELGPDLLEALIEAALVLGHQKRVAMAVVRHALALVYHICYIANLRYRHARASE